MPNDTYGDVTIPNNVCYGASTQRSINHFSTGSEKVSMEIIRAYSFIKEASAIVNEKKNELSSAKKQWICLAAQKIRKEEMEDHFPLSVWQTGSGTHTNMNVNEVIAYLANNLSKQSGKEEIIHPNDDVNLSQSSNDTFPSAIHISAKIAMKKKLFPAISSFLTTLSEKQKEFEKITIVGRTHYMDAVNLTLGQEFSGYLFNASKAHEYLQIAYKELSEIAIGGTAVGTGINTPAGFGSEVAKVLTDLVGETFAPSPNPFSSLSMNLPASFLSSCLRQLALVCVKMANDISYRSSGPNAGIGELILPANEPGSSIMPGKVNPTQCEALRMVALQVIANDQAITLGEIQGHLELSLSRPLVAHNLLQSIHLLADVLANFTDHCLKGIKANKEHIQKHLDQSLMMATVLTKVIGYDQASEVVQKAQHEKISLKQAATDLGFLTHEQLDDLL